MRLRTCALTAPWNVPLPILSVQHRETHTCAPSAPTETRAGIHMRILAFPVTPHRLPLNPNSPDTSEVPSLRFTHHVNSFRSPAQDKLKRASSTDAQTLPVSPRAAPGSRPRPLDSTNLRNLRAQPELVDLLEEGVPSSTQDWAISWDHAQLLPGARRAHGKS